MVSIIGVVEMANGLKYSGWGRKDTRGAGPEMAAWWRRGPRGALHEELGEFETKPRHTTKSQLGAWQIWLTPYPVSSGNGVSLSSLIVFVPLLFTALLSMNPCFEKSRFY